MDQERRTMTFDAPGQSDQPGPPTDQVGEIEAVIESSRKILDLKDGWDGEGSRGYDEATWDRTIAFVWNYARRLRSQHGVRIPAPKILPGPAGSIDLHWQETDFELLVNIPANSQERAEFYGDDYGGIFIKGAINPAVFNKGLIEWLQKAG
jgi:hypothetical protein